jgi:SWI/SNF-related matrix-associated actin-dependent regulator 1 of chromatin subfamily A
VWDIKSDGSKSFRLKDVVFDNNIQQFRSIIIDECHRVKDPSAQQTIFTKGIATGKEYVIMLSGTPVVNKPDDLIAQLSIMDRLKEFGGRTKFCAQYSGDDANLAQLSAQLYEHCMIRREKSKVLTQLPDKTRMDLYVDISNRTEYNLAAADLAAYLREYTECTDREIRRKMRMEALVKFMTLRSLSAKGKVKQAIDFINTFLANGKPLIVFCSLHDIVDELLKAFPEAVTVTGRDSMIEKQAAVDAFQSGRAQLIICSIKAAGVGLTLTASSNVAFIELAWTYADCCQCEDRAHRIGQKDNVTCYYLLGTGTIDNTLYNIIHRKKSIANQIMACDDEIPRDEIYFNELVASFLNTQM